MRFDLHTHTNASDGALAPAQLVQRAADLGLDGIALTDHDSVAGIPEALAAAERLGLTLIPGIELSVQEGEQDVHVLGYFIDHRASDLREALEGIFAMRVARVSRMVERLRALGCDIDVEAVRAEAGAGAPGRPHVARALMRRGQIAYYEEAFDRFLGNGGPAYVPKTEMDSERGLALLKRFGAVPVLAHPVLADYPRFLDRFIALGLKGLEVDHPKQDRPVRDALRALCAERGLLATGGSDFHAPGLPERDLGGCAVAGETLDALRALRPAAPA